MKTSRTLLVTLGSILLLIQSLCALDPVKTYLEKFSPDGGDKNIYSDDNLLRLDVDVDNDGQPEVLLSMSRDRNGKQGNNWSVYKKIGGDFVEAGGISMSVEQVYSGKIDELGKNGLVSFWSSGGGEGILVAHLFDGQQITEKKLAELRKDPNSKILEGAELFEKYLKPSPSILPDSALTTTGANELSIQYGIKVDARTWSEALKEKVAARIKKLPPSPPQPLAVKPPAPLVVEPSVKSLPTTTSALPPQEQPESNLRLFTLLGLIAAAAIAVVTVMRKAGK